MNMNFLKGLRKFHNYHQIFLCLFFCMTVILLLTQNLCSASPQRYEYQDNRYQPHKLDDGREPKHDGYYTIYGETCKDRCRNEGTNYYWCYKKGESGWDYCSPYYDTTRYGRSCHSSCGQFGKYYYWCYETSGSWDYCSPIVHKS